MEVVQMLDSHIRKSVNWGGKVKRLNWLVVIALVLSLAAPFTTVPAPVSADNDPPRADPELLRLAAEHPDDIFMVIIQREVKHKDLPDDEPETEVAKAGGKVKKQLKMIGSFSAELTGKQIEKLAKKKKVRWISFDAPLFSTSVGEPAPIKAIVTNAPLTAVGTVYTVSNTNNSGAGSLRQAITDANGHAGADTIQFNIAGTGVHTIVPTSALPTITGAVILDATTDDSFAANGNRPAIMLDGNSLAANGLVLSGTADGTTIRGLVIRDFGTTTSHDGIEIQANSNNNTIVGNYIGQLTNTGADAGAAEANTGSGINLRGSNNTIGGATAADRNVIAGNVHGLYLQSASSNVIIGNYIGTDGTGMLDLGNSGRGIWLESGSNNNIIGGTAAGVRNVISGNNQTGILISDGASPGLNATGNVIQGNTIGVAADGTTGLGNLEHGVQLSAGVDNNLIGGTAGGAGNIIANSQWRGVNIQTAGSTGITVLGNSIYANGLTGIDLGDNGVTGNNGTKSSSLSNYDMDYPVITSASLSYCSLTVAGYVGSAANQSTFANARIEFFKAAADSTGYGEGQTFLGTLTTDTNGNFSGNISAIGFNTGDRLTATATDSSNNTSEFGPNFRVTSASGSCVPSAYTGAVRADQVSSTLQGQGVTVAVVDSGITSQSDLQGRIVANNNQTAAPDANDIYGHGTHVAGIIGGNGTVSGGARKGIAPQVNLINVKVSGDNGMSYASDLVDGLQWINDNRTAYNIKVVNISMNSAITETYQTSPIDAAVEILWFNGIVVVVAAGNNGGPGAIYPPANDPFVITVGAADDLGTTSLADDGVASFSAYGTTENGFAKPDLVAPGRNLISLNASTNSAIYNNHAPYRVDNAYFRMSGTSMSAPVVSGAVALLLQDEPNLNPDQVKYRLTATANKTWPGYNATKAGAGYLDIYAAVNGTTTQTANTGIAASNMLTTGSDPINWGSVQWGSVQWGSVQWGSVQWGSVQWGSVQWGSDYWGP
jgi:hypothetical protein